MRARRTIAPASSTSSTHGFGLAEQDTAASMNVSRAGRQACKRRLCCLLGGTGNHKLACFSLAMRTTVSVASRGKFCSLLARASSHSPSCQNLIPLSTSSRTIALDAIECWLCMGSAVLQRSSTASTCDQISWPCLQAASRPANASGRPCKLQMPCKPDTCLLLHAPAHTCVQPEADTLDKHISAWLPPKSPWLRAPHSERCSSTSSVPALATSKCAAPCCCCKCVMRCCRAGGPPASSQSQRCQNCLACRPRAQVSSSSPAPGTYLQMRLRASHLCVTACLLVRQLHHVQPDRVNFAFEQPLLSSC